MMSYYNRQANTMYNVQIECQRIKLFWCVANGNFSRMRTSKIDKLSKVAVFS
ncbi:hypothetical protein T05_3615 [Trichinella murrelli]|uniref:Uncharacterized protein n=1 Tax=Trichinella murrelli TaxID=144512 RepID=A0A0V0SWH8_9BILA|nr:hypothetical protein T05_3615 [Trichinella murrelli]